MHASRSEERKRVRRKPTLDPQLGHTQHPEREWSYRWHSIADVPCDHSPPVFQAEVVASHIRESFLVIMKPNWFVFVKCFED